MSETRTLFYRILRLHEDLQLEIDYALEEDHFKVAAVLTEASNKILTAAGILHGVTTHEDYIAKEANHVTVTTDQEPG